MTSVKLLINESARSLLAPLTNGIASDFIKPTIAAVYLTSYCNSQCNMCDFWKNDRDPNELSSEQWGVVFSRLKAFGVRYVGINASGEVFTRKDIFKILTHLRELDLDFGINSNGTLLTKSKAKQLAELSPRVITLGLDGIGDENYFATRGLKSGFSKLIKNIEYLKNSGIENIRIGSVMMRDNIKDWMNLCEFTHRYHLTGIRFTAFHEDYFSNAVKNVLSPYKDPSFIAKVRAEVDKIITFKKNTGLVNNSEIYLRSVSDFFQSQHEYFPHHCLQGSNRIEIDVYGNVTLCSFMTDALGNLNDTDMWDIWNSTAHKSARYNAYHGKCPHCFLSCYAEENIRLSSRHFVNSFGDTIGRAKRLIR